MKEIQIYTIASLLHCTHIRDKTESKNITIKQTVAIYQAVGNVF